MPVPTASGGRGYAGQTSATVAGLQGWACRVGGVGVGWRVCGEGRAVVGLVGALVGLCVLGVVGGGVGVWFGRRRRDGGRGRGEEGEGGWL